MVIDTMDVPLAYLERGCLAFNDEAGRIFAPSISEIRTQCAIEVERVRAMALGLDPDRPPEPLARKLSVAGELAWAREHSPDGQVPKILGIAESIPEETLTPDGAIEELTLAIEMVEGLQARNPNDVLPLHLAIAKGMLTLAAGGIKVTGARVSAKMRTEFVECRRWVKETREATKLNVPRGTQKGDRQ